MRVLYFHQHFSTPSGATGIRSYEMAQRLLKRGHQVTMVCGSYNGGVTGITEPFVKGKRRANVNGIDVIEFDLAYSNNTNFLKRSLLFVSFALKSIGLLFSEKYDIVFSTTTPLTAGIPGIVAHYIKRKPFVFEVRDLWPELPKAMGVIKNPLILGAMSLLETLSYKAATCCIGLSPGIVKGIKEKKGQDSRVVMIPNGCDFAIFSADDITPWRPDTISEQDFLAIFTGTHGIANGLDAVLNTAAVLKQRGRTDIKLALFGQGKLKAELEARAKEEELDNIIFHQPVNKTKLAGLMASANIGMQTLANVPAFYYGTSPNKFFDYISAGLPVINNYPGWLAENIERHDCGYAVEPDNPTAFADALIKAADNPKELALKGDKAKQLAQEVFNRHDLANLWVDTLEQVNEGK